jgi:signal transduction histidine kinase
MRIGETLVGLLRVGFSVDKQEAARPERGALLTAVARLGTLVLERERLLSEWADAQARELALRETQAQMETFLGIAGHELKNPLAILTLSMQVTERRLQRLAGYDGAAASNLFEQHLAQARQQVQRLERLVNVSRVRAGKLDLHLDAADLAAIVHEAVEEQRQAHPARTLLLYLPAGLRVPVWADADRLRQVVTNYLTNALKYSPADSPVEVGLDLEQQQARVWVHDEGPGLPPEEQERIWDCFHRAKGIKVQSGTGVGLGLGLHICRTIVERLQGQVGVQSMPGQGSTFWFTVPLSGQPCALSA